MKHALIIFLAICAFATAFVPREKRALNTEDEVHSTKRTATSTSSSGSKRICAEFTPCAWSIYNPVTKMTQGEIENTYCICAVGQECIIDEDDITVSTFVHRCRPPQANQPEDR